MGDEKLVMKFLFIVALLLILSSFFARGIPSGEILTPENIIFFVLFSLIGYKTAQKFKIF